MSGCCTCQAVPVAHEVFSEPKIAIEHGTEHALLLNNNNMNGNKHSKAAAEAVAQEPGMCKVGARHGLWERVGEP